MEPTTSRPRMRILRIVISVCRGRVATFEPFLDAMFEPTPRVNDRVVKNKQPIVKKHSFLFCFDHS